nr:MAG TPA: Protein of unknown function (DUF3094) [Caudoviricetes sp.]
MEYLKAGFTYLLDKPYGWVVFVVVGVVVVIAAGFSVGLAKVKSYIRTVGRQEILEAKAKGYTVSEIVDTAVQRTVDRVKQVPSKLAQVVVTVLTSKYILSIIKKNVSKIVAAISDEEVKSEPEKAEEE